MDKNPSPKADKTPQTSPEAPFTTFIQLDGKSAVASQFRTPGTFTITRLQSLAGLPDRITNSPSSPKPTSSPTLKSWMDESGCVRRARSISAETFRSKSRSSFGQPRAFPNPTCSTRKSGEPLGSRSRAGTSSEKKTTPSILTWSASSPSAWAQPPMSSTAATCRCSPNRNG
jgi:hypothetical protein